MALYFYKNKEKNVWLIYDEETDTIDYVLFGGVIYGYIAHVLNMSNDGDINLIFDEDKSEFFESCSLEKSELKTGLFTGCIKNIMTDTVSYKEQALRLINILTAVAGKSPHECEIDLCHIAEEFKWFGFNVVRDLPYNLSHDRDNNHIKYDIECIPVLSDDGSENETYSNPNIKYVGVRYMNGSYCELFHVDDFSVAFCLDLYAYLFDNKKMNYSIKLCNYCNRVFFAGRGNHKRCNLCKEEKAIDRAIRKEQYDNNVLLQKRRQIRNYLERSKAPQGITNKIFEFEKQCDYYIDKLNDKEIVHEDIHEQYDKELPIISCIEDILRWCDGWLKMIKEEVKKWRKS